MRGVERHVTEKWLIRFVTRFHKRHSPIREDIRHKTLRFFETIIALQFSIEILIPVALRKPEKFIEPLANRVVRPVGSVVPFTKTAGRIPMIPKHLR